MSSDGSVEIRISGSVDSSLAASTATAKAEIGGLAASTQAATVAATGLTTATVAETAATEVNTAAHTNARAVTESLAAIHEIMQGRTSRLGGTLMILTQAVTGASTGLLVMGAAVVGAAVALGYLYERAVNAEDALERLKIGAEFAGNLSISKEKIQQFISELDRLPGVTAKDAEETAAAFARMRGMSEPEFDALQHMAGQFAESTGVKAPEAAKELIRAFESEKLSAKELQAVFPAITQAQVTHIEKTQQAGNANATAAQLILLLRQQLQASIPDLTAHDTAVHASWMNWLHYLVTGNAVIGTEKEHTRLIQEQTAEWKKNAAAIDADVAAMTRAASAAPLKDMPDKKADFSVYEQQERAKAAAFKEGSAERIRIAQDEYNKAVSIFGAQSSEAAQALGRLNEERRAAADAKLVIDRESSRAAATLAREEEGEKVAAVRESASAIISADKGSTDERIAAVRKLWSDFIAGEHLTAAERISVAKEEAAQESEIRKQAAREQGEIVRTQTQIEKALATGAVEVQKAALDIEVAYMQITALQKIKLLEQIEVAALKAQEAQLQLNQEGTAPDSEAWWNYEKQIEEVQAKIRGVVAQSNQETTDTVLKQWQQILGPIESGIDGMFNNMLSGNKSFGEASKEMLQQIVESWIAARIKVEFDYLAGQAAMAFGAQDWMNKSLIQFMAGQTKETAATVTAQATQTGAVATGVAAQTAIKSGGAAASNAVEATANSKSILGAAYTSAAEAYKSVMQAVPAPLNLVIAPIAAAGTFAAVAAYDVVSAEGGEWRVATDGAPYMLHAEEAVMPAKVAQPMRDFFESGSSSNGGGGGGGDTHYHSHNYNNAVNFESIAHDIQARRKFEGMFKNAMRNSGVRSYRGR